MLKPLMFPWLRQKKPMRNSLRGKGNQVEFFSEVFLSFVGLHCDWMNN